MATISHKKNFITCLSTLVGETIVDHDHKAQVLWDSFKERLGVSEFTGISYNLASLITTLPMEHLNLDSDFSEEEITTTIKKIS